MVAISANSTYLASAGEKLVSHDVERINVMFSFLAGKDSARSEVTLTKRNGDKVPNDILKLPVSPDSTLTVHDVLEMFIQGNCKFSNNKIAAAIFYIYPKTWTVQSTEVLCSHAEAGNLSK